MVVLVITACPAGLRGHLTRWLLEISPGVFIGHINPKVRDHLWARVIELAKDGRAILIHQSEGEQKLAFKVHRHDWQPTDLDGIHLMLRRPLAAEPGQVGARPGWSKASRYQKARNARAARKKSE